MATNTTEGEMAERVLTDREIGGIAENGQIVKWPPSNGWYFDFARAVEAAVMGKLVLLSDGSYAVFRDGKPLVTEREARNRERDAVVHWCQEKTLLPPGAWNEWLNAHYPLPTCDKCGHELP